MLHTVVISVGQGVAVNAKRNTGVKVYATVDGCKRLIGRAEVPDDTGPVFAVPLFGPVSVIRENYSIGTVTYTPLGGALTVERAVLLAAGQAPELLPGWMPLAS
jgi:hypothetical protein